MSPRGCVTCIHCRPKGRRAGYTDRGADVGQGGAMGKRRTVVGAGVGPWKLSLYCCGQVWARGTVNLGATMPGDKGGMCYRNRDNTFLPSTSRLSPSRGSEPVAESAGQGKVGPYLAFVV